ncbi:MAG: dihydroneopterin aldolase [Actinomycetota bacterium]
MVTSRLFLTGITARGRHGANPGEKDEAQDFVVDLDVEVEVGADQLASTTDYRTVIRTARETVERDSFDLLESLARSVARAVVRLDGVVRVNAVVHKPAAARSNDVHGVAAAATADR